MQNPRVLHLLESSRFSGAENVVCQIIRLFENTPIEMAYCSPDGQIRTALKAKGVNFIPLSALTLTEVRRVINDFKPDIIHAHDVKASVIAALVSKNAEVISHMHVNHETMRNVNVKTLLYLLSTYRFKYIYWVSESALNNYKFKKYVLNKSSVLRNVIHKEDIINRIRLDNANYSHDIVYVGRLTYQKHPERLLEVIKRVIERYDRAKVAIVGDGDLARHTVELSKKLGIDKNVTFFGFRDNPIKILYCSKVMLMTSRYEGTPMSALEAQALGVPIVSTPTDGLSELIIDGYNGFLSSDNEVLAEKVVQIITDSSLYKRLSQNSVFRFEDLNDLQKYKRELQSKYLCK